MQAVVAWPAARDAFRAGFLTVMRLSEVRLKNRVLPQRPGQHHCDAFTGRGPGVPTALTAGRCASFRSLRRARGRRGRGLHAESSYEAGSIL